MELKDGYCLETNMRSEADIFEAMMDEFCTLVPVALMIALIPAKYEKVRAIEE